MLLDNGVFGDVTDGYRNALVTAYEHFLSWRKIWKVPCSQKRFTPGQLQREGYGFYKRVFYPQQALHIIDKTIVSTIH